MDTRKENPSADETVGAFDRSDTGRGPSRGVGINLATGTKLGRYEVRERLGAGGMGVVFSAYDPELDRQIAIKILRDEAVDTANQTRSDEARRRLLREAQAMAKLDHPNVVKVHDVGIHERRVFIAMEFVAGHTLKGWLASGPRPWRTVLDVFIQAGRGLAAAHDVGLVHRDFKPDNVMLDARDHVRVMDFGLARAVEAGEGYETTRQPPDSVDLSVSLTRTGSLVGTPAYMAPEQHLAQPTDARTDQFSFCVALWEGLYGARPFQAETMTALSVVVVEGEITEPKNDRGVPRRLRRALLRGLSANPEKRFASMDALVAELVRDPAKARRRFFPVVGTAAIGLAGVATALFILGDDDTCASGPEELAAVWHDGRRGEVRTAIEATGLAYASASADRVVQALDDYGDAWVAMHRETCEATVGGTQSAELLDLRMACLADRRSQFDAWATMLAAVDETTVQGVVGAVDRLGPLSRCSDPEQLFAQFPPPSDPALGAEVDALRVELAAVRALEAGGRWDDALKEVEPLLERALKLDYPPLQAEVRVTAASLNQYTGKYERAEELYTDAYWQAAAIKHERVAAWAAGKLVEVIGHDLGRPHDVELWERQGRAAVERVGPGGDEEIELLMSLGMVAIDQGEYEQGLAHHKEALRLRRAVSGERTAEVGFAMQNVGAAQYRMGDYASCLETQTEAHAILVEAIGPSHPKTAKPLLNRGAAAFSLRRHDEAVADYRAALEILEAAHGKVHARIGDVLHNLGLVLRDQGEFEQAQASTERAIDVFREALGDEHPRLGAALNALGNLFYTQGEYGKAQAQFEKALAQRLKAVGPDHPHTAYSHQNLGNVAYMQGDLDRARTHYERALEIREAKLPKDHPSTALSLQNLAGVLGEVGDAETARQYYARALAIRRGTLPPTHPLIASSLVGLGRSLTDLDRPDDAIERITEALKIYGTDADPASLGEARFARARALDLRGRGDDRKQAIELAKDVRKTMLTRQPALARQLEQVDAWLKDRR